MSSSPEHGSGSGSGSASASASAEVRTYRGSSVEELIPRIRAELGPNAIILRERQGLTGGVGGFFARRCVEIEAQAAPRVSVYADDDGSDEEIGGPIAEPAAAGELDLADIDEERELDDEEFETASTPPGFAQRLAAAAEPEPVAEPEPEPVAEPEPAPIERSEPAPIAEPEPVVPSAFRAPRPASPTFIAFDELGGAAEAEKRPLDPPTTQTSHIADPTAREIPIPVALETASAPAPAPVPSVFRQRAVVAPAAPEPSPPAAPEPSPPAAPEPFAAPEPAVASDIAAELVTRLADRGMSLQLAREIVDRAVAVAGPDAGSGIQAAAQAALAAALPAAPPLPVRGGAIAVVGSGGSGKTRSVAGVASALAGEGHAVTVARLGGIERGLELGELLRGEDVELIPAMRTQATARAVASARTRGLVIVDTASTSPGDHAAVEVLAETLEPFALDGVLMCAPTTFTARALQRLADGYAGLPIRSLIATHADEGSDLGVVAELSIRSGVPVSHLHAGLDSRRAVTAVDPARLAGELLRDETTAPAGTRRPA